MSSLSTDNSEHNEENGGRADDEYRREDGENRRRDDAKGLTEYRISRFFSGPIPPADMLAGYDEVVPGSADRLISMAERQHRTRMILSLLSPAIGFAGLVVLLAFALIVVTFGVDTVVAVLSALPPNILLVAGGSERIRRNIDKSRMDQQRHALKLRLDEEKHNLDIQIRRERHELDMRIDLERHQLALQAGEERLSIPPSTEDAEQAADDEPDNKESENRLSS